MEHLDTLYELCDIVSKELEEVTEKARKAGGMSGADIELTDKISHTLKSIKTVIAMEEAGDGYSRDDGTGRGYSRTYHYPYMRGGSYARGRGSNAKRDSMGRYSSMYYDGVDDMMDKLHDLMDEAPDEKTKAEFKKFIAKMEQM